MKSSYVSFILLMIFLLPVQKKAQVTNPSPRQSVKNLIIITTDGFRWQEIFSGADPVLLGDETVTPDHETIELTYGGSTPGERRKELMPFLWNVVAKKGQLYGNRFYDNKMNVSNLYAISYPGYNEIFTGNIDLTVASNGKKENPNINVLEYLDAKPAFHGKVVAFTSWDVFPYILNEKRNKLPVNSGYEMTDSINEKTDALNTVQQLIGSKTHTRKDRLTFIAAKNYMEQYHPRVVYLGLGETDENAHQGRYDLYLQKANEVDRMIAELWHWIQTTPEYKDNTTLLITTDHGRGAKDFKWSKHGAFTKGSSQTWMAVIGPGIEPLGEIKEEQQLWQKQVAQTIASLLGEEFLPGHSVAAAIPLP